MRNGLGHYAALSSGSYGQACASGKLTFAENNEAILLGGRESTLQHALINSGSLLGESVDLLVQPVSEPMEPLEKTSRRAKQLKLRGQLQVDEALCLRVGGEKVKDHLGDFLGQEVDFVVARKNELFIYDPGIEKVSF